MRFFNVDLHISVIADIKRIFTDLGHTVDDLCLSGHHWVMDRKQDHVAELSGEKWTQMVWNEKWDTFYDAHKNSLKKYDGFIVTYPPIFARLYEKFDKPIIVDMPIRYDYAVHGCPDRLGRWNEWLKKAVAGGQVKLVANNKYDQEYCRILSGLKPVHIPSLCEYFPKRTKNPRNGFVLYEDGCSLKHLVPDIRDRKAGLPHGWKWNDIHRFRAVVHMPYQVSTMSIFEQYTANVPMIFPAKKFLTDMYFSGKWPNVLSQVSTNQLSRKKPVGTPIELADKNSLDPNRWDDRAVIDELWLEHADFYDIEWMPLILTFDTIEKLRDICKFMDYEKISACMAVNNRTRKERVYASWTKLLGEL